MIGRGWRWPTRLIFLWTWLIAIFTIVVVYRDVPQMASYKPPEGSLEPVYRIVYTIFSGVIYWAAGMIVLGPLWWFTRPGAKCPACGAEGSARDLTCPRCGHALRGAGPVLLTTTSPPALQNQQTMQSRPPKKQPSGPVPNQSTWTTPQDSGWTIWDEPTNPPKS